MSDFIYLFGGNTNAGNTDNIQKMNITVETWSTIATPLSQAKYGMGTPEYVNEGITRISVVNGYSFTYIKEHHVFNTVDETLTARTSYPGDAAYHHSAGGANFDGYGLILGGYDGSTYLNTQYKYSNIEDIWTTLLNLQRGCLLSSILQHDSIQGNTNSPDYYNLAGDNSGSQKEMEQYCVMTGGSGIIKGLQLYSAYGRRSVQSSADYGFSSGGSPSMYETANYTNQYNFSGDSWTTKKVMNSKRQEHGLVANIDGTYLYAIAGYIWDTGTRLNSVEKYNVAGNSWTNLAGVIASPSYAFGFATNYSAKEFDWDAWLIMIGFDEQKTHDILENILVNYRPQFNMQEYNFFAGIGRPYSNCFFTESNEFGVSGWSDEQCVNLIGYRDWSNLLWASKLTGCIAAEHSPSGNIRWYHCFRNASAYWNLFYTEDKLNWVLAKTFQNEYAHDSGSYLCMDTFEDELYICYSTTNSGSPKGLCIMKYDIYINNIDWKVAIFTGNYAYNNSEFCLSINKINKKMLVTYDGQNTVSWKHSDDGGLTWSNEKTFSDFEPVGKTDYWYDDTIVHHYSYKTNYAEAVMANESYRLIEHYYYDYDNDIWYFESDQQHICVYSNVYYAIEIDVTIDQNNGHIFGIHRYYFCGNDVIFRRFAFYHNEDGSWANMVHGEQASEAYTDAGQPCFGVAWNEYCWLLTITGVQAEHDADQSAVYTLYETSQFIGYDGTKSVIIDYLHEKKFHASDLIYSFSNNIPVMFNYPYSYNDPYHLISPIGPDTVIYLTLFDKNTRKPLTEKTVLLKDTDSGSTIVTMSEHSTYKGLYYGTLTARFTISEVDVYVDSIKQDTESPFSIIPSDRIPRYRQQIRIVPRPSRAVKHSIVLWDSINNPLDSNNTVEWIDDNGGDAYKAVYVGRGHFVVDILDSIIATLRINNVDDNDITSVALNNDDIIADPSL